MHVQQVRESSFQEDHLLTLLVSCPAGRPLRAAQCRCSLQRFSPLANYAGILPAAANNF